MAGSQFLSPQPVSVPGSQRRFTLGQANATLPLVRRIVGDIVRTHEQVARQQANLEKAGKAEQSSIHTELQAGLTHLQDYVDELAEVGCELKDYRLGLIDFIGHHQGRDVYLCWKLGEDQISFWHELEAGAAGRQPIATLNETGEESL